MAQPRLTTETAEYIYNALYPNVRVSTETVEFIYRANTGGVILSTETVEYIYQSILQNTINGQMLLMSP